MNTNELKIALLRPRFVNWASDYIYYEKDIPDSECFGVQGSDHKIVERASNFGFSNKGSNSL